VTPHCGRLSAIKTNPKVELQLFKPGHGRGVCGGRGDQYRDGLGGFGLVSAGLGTRFTGVCDRTRALRSWQESSRVFVLAVAIDVLRVLASAATPWSRRGENTAPAPLVPGGGWCAMNVIQRGCLPVTVDKLDRSGRDAGSILEHVGVHPQ